MNKVFKRTKSCSTSVKNYRNIGNIYWKTFSFPGAKLVPSYENFIPPKCNSQFKMFRFSHIAITKTFSAAFHSQP